MARQAYPSGAGYLRQGCPAWPRSVRPLQRGYPTWPRSVRLLRQGYPAWPCAVAIGAVLCLAQTASAATIDWLKIARNFREKAVEKLEEVRAGGTEGTFEAKQALNYLKTALKLLSKYEEPVPGDVQDEIAGINSLIYWACKTGTVSDAGDALPPVSNPGNKTENELAREYFERAEGFASKNPDGRFLITVRYFEVAKRFERTDWGRRAGEQYVRYQRPGAGGGDVVSPPAGRGGPATEPAVDESASLGTLVEILRTPGSAVDKAKACGEHLTQFPAGARRAEIESLHKVYSARTTDGTVGAWAEYWTAFPKGSLADQALAALRRSRQALRLQAKLAFVAKDTDRTRKLGEVYLQVFPRAADATEVSSLLDILKTAPGPGRSRLVRNHLRAHAEGAFAGGLKIMLAKSSEKAQKEAFERLREQFAETRSRTEILAAVGNYLRSYPGSEHAAEVKAVRSVLDLDNARSRLVAARKYVKSYPAGVFIDAVRRLEADLVGQHEKALYLAAMEMAKSRETYVRKLLATRNYLEEYPEGEHAEEVRGAAKAITALIEEEKRAFEELERSVEKLAPGGGETEKGLGLVEAFIRKYAGGAHVPKAVVRRGALERRLGGEMEAAAFKALMDRLGGKNLRRIAKARECLTFLKRYKHGKHSREVAARLKGFAAAHLGSHEGPVRAAAFSPDSKMLVTVDADRGVRDSGLWVWGLPAGELRARYGSRPRFSVSAAAFAPASRELWLGEVSGGLIAWDMSSGGVTGRYRLGSAAVRSVSPQGDLRAATAFLGDPKVRVWSGADWSLEATVSCPGGASAAALSPTGNMVAVGGRDGRVQACGVGDTEPEWIALDAHAGEVSQVAYSPNGLYVASCSSEDGTVSLWNAASGKRAWEVEDPSVAVAFASNVAVLTGTALRSVSKGKLITKLVTEKCPGGGPVAASRDGQFAFTSDREGTGTLWYLPALLWR